MSATDQEFVEFIVKNLVDHPEEVKIKRDVDEMGVLLTLDVHPDDMGKVIGRRGATAKAIRTLLRVVGMKNHARVTLKVNEPPGSERKKEEGATESSNTSSDSGSVADSVDAAMQDLKV